MIVIAWLPTLLLLLLLQLLLLLLLLLGSSVLLHTADETPDEHLGGCGRGMFSEVSKLRGRLGRLRSLGVQTGSGRLMVV